MAVTLDELRAVMRMELKPFERDVQKLMGINTQTARKIEQTWRATNRRLDGIGKNMAQSLTAPLAGIGAALGAAELARLTGVWTDLTSRVNLAAGSMDAGEAVMGRIVEMARRTYSPLEATAESFLDNATALKELGYVTEDQLNYTESLNNALVVGAIKGERAKTVQNALAKAMAGGKLQGENLNTVIQQGGRVAEALAAGLGVGVNQLRALGAQGKITSRDVFKALTSQMGTLRQEAANMPATISDGFQLLNNALLEYVGNADKATGISSKISEALIIIADNFDKVADSGLQLAAVIAGALVGRSLMGMIRTLGLAGGALTTFTRGIVAARSMAGLASAIGGVSAAAGPVGLLVGGAVVAAMMAFSKSSDDASDGAKRFAERLKIIEEGAPKAAEAAEKSGARLAEATKNAVSKEMDAAIESFEEAKNAAISLFSEIIDNAPRRLISDGQLDSLRGLRDGLNENGDKAEEVKNALYALANSDPNFQRLADQMAPLLDRLALVSAGARGVQADLANLGIGVSFRSLEDSSMEAYRAMQETNKAFIDGQMKQNALSKEQLAIENEIIKVRKESAEAGAALTEKQIRDLATANVAAGERRSAEGKKEKAPKKTADDRFDNMTQSIMDRIAAMRLEADVTGLTYQEQEKRRMALDLEQEALRAVREEARKKGDADWQNVQLSPDQVKSIDTISDAYARQAEALRKIQDAQARAENAAQDFYDSFKSGVMDAITGADSLNDALAGVLKRLGELALNSAFDSLFRGATESGGWLTNIFKKAGWSDGGYTGPGGKNDPAGVVHKGEYVFDQDSVRAAGGPANLDALRKKLKGYSSGGYVGGVSSATVAPIRIPKMPDLSALGAASGGGQGVHVTVGVSVDESGNLQAYVKNVSQQTTAKGIQAFQRDPNFDLIIGRTAKNALGRGRVR